MSKVKSRYLLFLVVIIFVSSCKKRNDEPEDLLLVYGDRFLTTTEVVDAIPAGILPQDSVTLFYAIVENWIRDNVLSDFAEEHLYDIALIERKVRDYKNSLIVQEYMGRLRESKKAKVPEQRIKEYYDLNRKDLLTEVPLIKGVFLKIPSDSKGKETIRNMISSDNPEMIDKLEQEWLDRALEYNYFKDKWIDWNALHSMIPIKCDSVEVFLQNNKYYETEYGDFAYYLYITDWMPGGLEQPFEFAHSWISDLLSQRDFAHYENSLLESLIEKSIKENKLQIKGYDPVRHELIKK